MSKVFDAHASRKGVQATALLFYDEYGRLNSDQTLEQLQLEEQDLIDVFMAGG